MPRKKDSTTRTAAKAASKSVAESIKDKAGAPETKSVKGKSDGILIQSNGKDHALSDIMETCKNAYRGGTRKQIKSIKVYVKTEGKQLKAYYVVNDNISGLVDL